MEYMLEEDIGSSLIEILMGEDSPFCSRREYSMMSRSFSTKITSLSRCVALILENIQTIPEALSRIGIDINGNCIEENNQPDENDLLPSEKKMSTNIFKCIHSTHLYDKLLSNDSIEPNTISRIIKRLATNNLHISLIISETIVRGIQRASVDETKIFCEALYTFLSITDSFRRQRMEAVLGVPTLSQNTSSLPNPALRNPANPPEEQQLLVTHYGVYS